MNKSVLVIGGSAFVGRVFSIQASKSGDFDLHVVNRGNFPLNLENVAEYKCNRHSPRMIARLIPDIKYDAIVDFCAYNPGEIREIIDVLGARTKQYIFISSANVYVPSEGVVDESVALLDITNGADSIDKSVYKKILLENELKEACTATGIKYTILRPAFIYGPFNYAPRESYFIEMIARGYTLPVPIDSPSRFTFVYVVDVARALMLCIGDKRAYDGIFNLSGVEGPTYGQLISDFERFNSGPFDTKEVTVQQVIDENIPLPFPLTEDMVYSGEKFAKTFNFEYTPFSEGMEKTFKVFYSLFTS